MIRLILNPHEAPLADASGVFSARFVGAKSAEAENSSHFRQRRIRPWWTFLRLRSGFSAKADKPRRRARLGKILLSRKGSRLSRIFRHIFEHKAVKRILGFNLAVIMVTSSVIPNDKAFAQEFEQSVVGQGKIQLETLIGVQYPIEKVSITQGFRGLFHPGVDFDGETGDSIYPIMEGRVVDVSFSSFSYGNAVLIGHGGGIESLYAHLSKIEVEKGQEVNGQSIIGKVGSSGRTSGDHLHLEIRDQGNPVNPLLILPK